RVRSLYARPVGRLLEGLLKLIEVREWIANVGAGNRAVEVHLRQAVGKWIVACVDARNADVLSSAEAYVCLSKIAAKSGETEPHFAEQIRPQDTSKGDGKILGPCPPNFRLRS